MKVEITGASNFVNRMFEACGPYQWARELLQNSIEAGATKVEFGIEWQAVAKLGAYRRTVIDDGAGMDAEQLRAFFSTLGAGSKNIGDIHMNFGVGAKIATLPWNPAGVVVVSYREGKGSMIWIVLDEESEEYELVEFDTDEGKRVVIDPLVVDGVDWSALRPAWLKDHGTIVVLLGSKERPDTILGMNGEDIKGVSLYLNSRYMDLSALDVRVAEPRTDKRSRWPKAPKDVDSRLNVRRVWGAKHYLETDPEFPGGSLLASGALPLDGGRVQANWFLWQGERKSVHTYARETGFIAVQYGGELYQLTASKVNFRWFGITETSVQRDVTIVLEPQRYLPGTSDAYGVYPDQSRNRLMFAGDGERGAELPITRWAYEFAEHMPAEIHAAILAARGSEDEITSISDEYRQRLLERFGSRWLRPSAVTPADNGSAASGEPTEPIAIPKPKGERDASTREPKGTDKPARKRAERPTEPDGRPIGETGSGRPKNQPVDIPKYRFAHRDEFEEPWHLALWSPHEADGPTVFINVDSPILQEIIEYRQSLYPEIYAEEIANEIRKAFGDIAICKIAHSQRLTKLVPEEQLNEEYRNERALTISLMGLIAEESLIVQRLKGRFKKTASAL